MTVVKLGEICKVESGGTPSRGTQSNFNGDIPWVKIGDMLQGTVLTTTESITETGLATSSAKIWPAGTLLISIFATIGRTAVLGIPAASNQAIAGLQLDHDRVQTNYLRHFLDASTSAFEATSRGIAQNNINMSILREWPIPLPPLPEQRRIATILDKADRLRTQRREALAHLDALTRSIFDDMFGDPVSNELGWPKAPMSALLSSIESGRSPVCLARPATDGEWGVLKLGAISTQSWLPNHNKALADSQPDPRLEVKAGDVLFSRKNTPDLVAAVCLVNRTPPRLLLPDLIFRLCISDPDTVSNVYLASVLQHVNQRGEIQALASGSAQSMVNISKAKVMTISIPVPPPELQQTFARRVAGVDRLKEKHRTQLGELDTLFASLQHRAFRGEL
ncbi:restriction endonuclease subunit S [Arthrobacter antibioticus]|uniref:restriction endonuclease subunit S n=1 Tax=Arthrobacter sp. H35-MC1 TaxID=3046203 RepID=UPI0024BA3EA3|nr:restriction endonuclease subunit S [Arthrobacter sp. H35-MC1]MDJ0316033.1 restriction endonuclease subunit S [Arthrobacter sp. H35-MC1]